MLEKKDDGRHRKCGSDAINGPACTIACCPALTGLVVRAATYKCRRTKEQLAADGPRLCSEPIKLALFPIPLRVCSLRNIECEMIADVVVVVVGYCFTFLAY